MYCSNCGKKLSEDDFFCSNCGTPVLRQDLFNDNEGYNEDAFEETRLFTAEELGQFLNDQPEESAPVAQDLYQAAPQSMNQYQYQAPIQQDYQDYNDYQQDYIEEPIVAQDMPLDDAQQSNAKKGVDAKEMMAGALGSANAVMGKFKARRKDAKAKKADKKHAAVEIEECDDYIEESVEASNDGPVPLKKIILPVVVLGLIIGLVFGLVLVQPWNNDSESDTATGAIMIVDSIEQQ